MVYVRSLFSLYLDLPSFKSKTILADFVFPGLFTFLFCINLWTDWPSALFCVYIIDIMTSGHNIFSSFLLISFRLFRDIQNSRYGLYISFCILTSSKFLFLLSHSLFIFMSFPDIMTWCHNIWPYCCLFSCPDFFLFIPLIHLISVRLYIYLNYPYSRKSGKDIVTSCHNIFAAAFYYDSMS